MNIILSSGSSDPIYKQIVKQIQKTIFSGEIKSGDALPSIRSLAKDLKVSVITTKRSYEELERSGFIHTIAGKGSFVSDMDQESVIDKRKSILEDKLQNIVCEAIRLSIDEEELISTVRKFYSES